MTEMVSIKKLTGVSFRERLDPSAVEDYTEQMRIDPDAFPAIGVIRSGAKLYRWSGAHRCQAALNAGLSEIKAEVREGTEEDARHLARSDNSTNGVRRTNADKVNAVKDVLADPLFVDQTTKQVTVSQGIVAAECAVTQKFVSLVMGKLGYKPMQPNSGHSEKSRSILLSTDAQERDAEVLRKIRAGKTPTEVAREEGVSTQTIWKRQTRAEKAELAQRNAELEQQVAAQTGAAPAAPAAPQHEWPQEVKDYMGAYIDRLDTNPSALAAQWAKAMEYLSDARRILCNPAHHNAVLEIEKWERVRINLEIGQECADAIATELASLIRDFQSGPRPFVAVDAG